MMPTGPLLRLSELPPLLSLAVVSALSPRWIWRCQRVQLMLAFPQLALLSCQNLSGWCQRTPRPGKRYHSEHISTSVVTAVLVNPRQNQTGMIQLDQ